MPHTPQPVSWKRPLQYTNVITKWNVNINESVTDARRVLRMLQCFIYWKTDMKSLRPALGIGRRRRALCRHAQKGGRSGTALPFRRFWWQGQTGCWLLLSLDSLPPRLPQHAPQKPWLGGSPSWGRSKQPPSASVPGTHSRNGRNRDVTVQLKTPQ